MSGRTEWMIYGANGYSGHLVAAEARRRGLNPVLAGRRAGPIEKLAAELGLPMRVFDLDDAPVAAAAIAETAVVANCAGPFAATSAPMIDACLTSRAHYLDITGEIDVFLAAQRRHAEAQAAGIVICPGVGFDVIPTDCMAAVLKEALPNATHLEDEESSYGGRHCGLLFCCDELRRACRKRLRGRVEGEGHGRTSV